MSYFFVSSHRRDHRFGFCSRPLGGQSTGFDQGCLSVYKLLIDHAKAAGQSCGHRHANRHRFAMQERTVPSRGFDCVRKGMAII